MSNQPAGPALVQSVDRALSILEILARRHDAGVTEIGKELGVHKSTAFRLLAVLESRGFVEQAEDRGTYRLGLGVVRLAGAITAQLDLSKEGRDACERLASDLGETVNIAILDGVRAVNISQVRGSASVASQNWIGQQTPLYATSSGKVLLAFGRPEILERVLRDPIERFTPKTLAEPGAIREEIDRVRRCGWACTAEEYEVGLHAVAAPVRGADGTVLAAISISGPAYRLEKERFPEIARRVVEAGDEVSYRMGHLPVAGVS